MPNGDNPWLRENFQRNCIMRGISNAASEDLIIISDADEIPNPKKIKEFNVKKNMQFLSKSNFITN